MSEKTASASPLNSGAWKLESHHLALGKKRPSFEEWSSLGLWLGRTHDAIQFWVGDWMNIGEDLFGEKTAQITDEIGLSQQTLEQYAWVAKKVAPERRQDGLTWTHHRVVAELSPKDQARWLSKAVAGEEGKAWTAARLARELRDAKGGDAAADGLWLMVQCFSDDDLGQLLERLKSDGRKVHRAKNSAEAAA